MLAFLLFEGASLENSVFYKSPCFARILPPNSVFFVDLLKAWLAVLLWWTRVDLTPYSRLVFTSFLVSQSRAWCIKELITRSGHSSPESLFDVLVLSFCSLWLWQASWRLAMAMLILAPSQEYVRKLPYHFWDILFFPLLYSILTSQCCVCTADYLSSYHWLPRFSRIMMFGLNFTLLWHIWKIVPSIEPYIQGNPWAHPVKFCFLSVEFPVVQCLILMLYL